MRFKLFLPILFAGLLMNCSGDRADSEQPSQQEDRDDFVQLSVSILDSSGDPITPALLQIFPAETGTDGDPANSFYTNEDGVAEGWFDKNSPIIIKIDPAWHQPVEMLIPSYTSDQLSINVTPASLQKKETIRPSIVGNFNHFDSFSSVEMEVEDGGSWFGKIETDLPSVRYQINGFAHGRSVHGTAGELQADSDQPGIVSIIENDGSGPLEIHFEPARFSTDNHRAEIRFDEDTPLSTRGIAKLYAAMEEQAGFADLYRDDEERLATLFSDYLDHINRINNSFAHRNVELAHRISQARFLDQMQQDDRWVDQLLSDLDSGSEIWLFYPSVVHTLFSYSSRMEPVSKNLWDIYRQHRTDKVQAEALYSLLNFHYSRGEDEEWHEAHFELVRSYPESKRINYSYREGFAPESVVFIGRYFPDLTFAPLEQQADSLKPAGMSSSMSILYFWSLDDPNINQTFTMLETLEEQFAEDGIVILPIALNGDRERVKRFHQKHGHTWQAGFEQITSSTVQVLGITDTPHTIFLDQSNRVLYHGESILEDERLLDYVKEFYSN